MLKRLTLVLTMMLASQFVFADADTHAPAPSTVNSTYKKGALVLDPATGILSGVSSVSVGTYPNVQFQAIVTYQGSSYTFTAPAETITVTPS